MLATLEKDLITQVQVRVRGRGTLSIVNDLSGVRESERVEVRRRVIKLSSAAMISRRLERRREFGKVRE